jgi:ATP-dependent RNA helicase DeaD
LDTAADPTVTFRSLGLPETVLRALDDVGYEVPTPIQAQTIPLLLSGRDVLGTAQTGTGKTAAFALPALSRIDPTKRAPQVMVLAPTRELALQVAEAFQKYAAHIPGFHVLPVYGGQAYPPQLRALARGPHVIVGTPGRIMDHMRSGALQLDSLKMLILDEADEMLRMGFIDDVAWILEQVPAGHQGALFSATMPPQIRRIAQKHLNQPAEVTIASKTQTASTIRQRYWLVSGVHKLDALTRILEVEDTDGMLVFVRTKTATVELSTRLEARGYRSAPLSGDITQVNRERTVDRFRNGELDILVATDVAARGLDIERVSHVINFDIPTDTEPYVHRIGRTGRAGRSGEAILFVAPRERGMLRAIERTIGRPIEQMNLPTVRDVNAQRMLRFKQRVLESLQADGLDVFRDLIASVVGENEASELDVAAALARMAHGDQPFLLDEPELPPPRPERPQRDDRPQRDERPERRNFEDGDRPKRFDRAPGGGAPLEPYRIELGHRDGIRPAQIVATIAGEAGISGKMIGHIDIFEDYCTVDLPTGMPREILERLRRQKINRKPLRIARA